jgi:hypothetical protein
MNVPGEQHPKRAVLDPKLSNAFKDSHVPPQSVRLKPLLKNTLNKKKKKDRVKM